MNLEAAPDEAVLSQLVGYWEGILRLRGAPDQPFEEFPGKSENRWVLGGRFVEMTLRGGRDSDGWSALFYIGHERSERRYVVVSLEPGDRQVTIRRGEWIHDPGRLLLTSRGKPGEEPRRSRVLCDVRTPGTLKLELAEEGVSGEEFVRFSAHYRAAQASPAAATPRPPRRFVIA
jgi:hypothetical protein